MKIFITGGNGQVGFELRRSLSFFGDILAPSRRQLDLSNANAVDDWLQTHQPDLIVNAAAYTSVDKAESETELAQRLNAMLPAQLADYAAQNNIWLIHYSSDYVYPGTGDKPWREDSATGPLNVYGQTKLAGDEAVIASGCRHLIFRTSWVYSARGHNFMKTMLRLGAERERVSVVADQVGVPTPARLIAGVTAMSVSRVLIADKSDAIQPGVYHLAPRGESNWHQFAQEIFRSAAKQGQFLKIKPSGADAISTSAYPTPAERPLNSRLSVTKLEQTLGIDLPKWQVQLALTLEELISTAS